MNATALQCIKQSVFIILWAASIDGCGLLASASQTAVVNIVSIGFNKIFFFISWF